MNEDRVAGTAKNLAGQAQEGFGRATGDVASGVEGRIKQVAGAAQDFYGQARDAAGEAAREAGRVVQDRAAPLEEAIRKTIEDRPYTAVAVALVLGWCLGRISRPGW